MGTNRAYGKIKTGFNTKKLTNIEKLFLEAIKTNLSFVGDIRLEQETSISGKLP